MEDFQVIQPSPLLAPYVKHYWFMTTASPVEASERIIPTGMMSLMFHRGERLFSSSDKDWQPRAFLGGQGTNYTDLTYTGAVNMICVVFRPAGAKAFFHIPLIELNNLNVSVHNLGDTQLSDLEKRLADTPDLNACILLIEQFLFQHLRQLATHNLKRIDAAIRSIYSGQQNVEMLAQTACLGYKQFKRVFAEYVGANPKEYLRVVRFQKSLHILQQRPGIPLTQLAYECGYYDQTHFIKEFKQFCGYTPTEYLAICAPYSDLFS